MDVLREEHELYVINHAFKEGGERIEVFKIVVDDHNMPRSLTYMHSITSDEINKEAYGAFNSLAVLSPNKFYITRFTSPLEPYGEASIPFFKMIYDNVMKPTGVYFIEYEPATNDIKMKQVADGFAQANGIAFDLKKTHLWIADSYAKTVSKYERNLTDNVLIKHNEVKVGYMIDNLKFCEFSDRLYTAGISSIYNLEKKMGHWSKVRADHHDGVFSSIIELGIPEFGMGIKRSLVTTELLAPLSGALRIGNFLIGGSPIQDGIIVC